MKFKRFFITMVMFTARVGYAEVFYKIPDISYAEILNKQDRSVLYKCTRTVTHEGDSRVAKREYTNAVDNKIVARETAYYNKSGKVMKMIYEQFQTNENGEFEIKDGKVHFSFTKEGKATSDNEKLENNFVSQDEIIGYLYQNWDLLMKGESVHIRLPVIFRKETVGFKFFKEKETDSEIIIKMKPSSFVIAALVNPLLFHMQKQGDHRTLYVDGRVVPKLQEGDKWKDLDALLKMKY